MLYILLYLIHVHLSSDLVRRHAGVLGLSACILSSPYDVPTWMPQLLMDLSAHLNDTQPIEVHGSSPQTQLLSMSLLCASLLGPIKCNKNQYKPLSVWFRWRWKRLCLISAVLIMTTGWSTSSSSRTTSSWCSQTFSCHPATMHRLVCYKDLPRKLILWIQ